MQSLITQATHPERLRLVIYNQYDFWNEWDQKQVVEVKKYIDFAT